MKNTIKDSNNDSVGFLLDHIEILARNISKLELPTGLSLSNPDSAKESLELINQLKNKVQDYQKVAKILTIEINNISPTSFEETILPDVEYLLN